MSLVVADSAPWLRRFERLDVVAGGRAERAVAGCCVLVYVVDGVLELDQPVSALRRVLPGEVVLKRGDASMVLINGSQRQPLRLLVIAFADQPGAPRSCDVRYFPDDDRSGSLCLIASGNGEHGSLAHGGVLRAFLTSLAPRETVLAEMDATTEVFAHVIDGVVRVNLSDLEQGTGALISKDSELRASGVERAQVLFLEQRVEQQDQVIADG